MFRFAPLLAAGLFASALAAQSCYDTSLIETNALGVCNPNAAVSQCCPWGQICYSNGLCHNPNDTAIVGTTYTLFLAYGCTDRTANTGLCQAWSRCKNISSIGGGGGLTDCRDNKWCCYGTKGCSCSDPSAVFTLSQADIVTSLPASKPTPTSSAQLSTLTTSAVATSAISTNSVVLSSGLTTSTAATATAQPSTDSGGTSNAAAIGGGVGAGVGVALVVVIVAVILFMRRRKKAKTPSAELDGSTGHDGYVYSAAPKYAPVVYAHEAPTNETRELSAQTPRIEQKGNSRAELY